MGLITVVKEVMRRTFGKVPVSTSTTRVRKAFHTCATSGTAQFSTCVGYIGCPGELNIVQQSVTRGLVPLIDVDGQSATSQTSFTCLKGASINGIEDSSSYFKLPLTLS